MFVDGLLGDLGDEVRPVLLLVAGGVGELSEELPEVEVVLALEQRQQLVPEAIAGVLEIGVGGVLAPWLAERVQVGEDLGAGGFEHGAHDLAAANLQHGMNAGKAAGSGAAEKAEKNGFGLIVGGVGGGDLIERVLADKSDEELVAQLAGGGFEGERILFREARDIGTVGKEWEIVCVREFGDERFVGVGLVATNAVMEVNDGKNQAELVAEFEHGAEKGDGVGATGDGKAETVSGMEEIVLRDVCREGCKHGDIVARERGRGFRDRKPDIPPTISARSTCLLFQAESIVPSQSLL